jgi:phospholipid/cholesterol/gamma-HCH transport system substrate-binding protein
VAKDQEPGPAAGEDSSSVFERANRLAQRGEIADAEAAYRQADEDGHGTAAAYTGLFAEARDELGEAEKAYRRADERGDGYGAFRLGLLRSRAGDWDGAAEAWKRAEERQYEYPPFDPVSLKAKRAPAPPVAPGELQRSAFTNPVLIGAVTLLVAIVAVFLAYNANSGLPFVPTRELKVDFSNGAALVAGNDVDQGSFRIGLVSEVHPVVLADGRVGAQATLKLNQSNGRVPVDSTATILPRSLLGLKYLELSYGRSRRVFADGGTMGVSRTRVPVQFDDINTMFDARTRPAVQRDLAGYGDVLAARGSALNDTIASLPALFGHLRPVARYLSDPRTGLTRFLGALDGFFSTISPVAAVNSRLFTDQATSFAAISRRPVDLEATIRESPPTLAVSTESLRVQQPFLVDLTRFSRFMAPATAALRAALPNVNPALAAGVRVLPRTPGMNQKLQGVLDALGNLARDPGTNVAVNGLGATVNTLNPQLRYLGPYVTACNAWNYMWVEIADLVSQQTNFGMAQRALIQFGNQQQNSVTSLPADQPANGQGVPPGQTPEYLHGPVYAAAVDNNGNADCEALQRGYPLKLNHLDPQGRNLDADQHTPGDQGPTWTGLAKVPPGETFTRNPTVGPQTPFLAANP